MVATTNKLKAEIRERTPTQLKADIAALDGQLQAALRSIRQLQHRVPGLTGDDPATAWHAVIAARQENSELRQRIHVLETLLYPPAPATIDLSGRVLPGGGVRGVFVHGQKMGITEA